MSKSNDAYEAWYIQYWNSPLPNDDDRMVWHAALAWAVEQCRAVDKEYEDIIDEDRQDVEADGLTLDHCEGAGMAVAAILRRISPAGEEKK